MAAASYLAPPTEKEQVKIDSLRKQLEGVKLEDDDTSFLLSDGLLLRYLRHKEGKEEKALKAIIECVAWRKSTKPHHITFEQVREWASEGVSFCAGLTKTGIPVCHVRPVSGLKVDVEMRINYVIWMYEELMRRGYYEVVFVGDFEVLSAPTDEEKQVREKMDDMRSRYYPLFETKLFFVNQAMFLRAIFAVMTAFASSAQKETMNSGMKPKHLLEWIDASQLPARLGGTLTLLTTKKESGEKKEDVLDVIGMLPPHR